MNIDKRNNYKNKMTLNGIDTLSGYIPAKVDKNDFKENEININQCNYKVAKEKTYLLINPNKNFGGSEKLITKYSEFVEKMQTILNSVCVDLQEYDVIRTDFCFNSTDADTYENYQKLHRLIISCLAKAYKYKNCYVSCDLWDFERLSIAIKKDDSEAENYNKDRESKGTDESKNRLELRSKRMSGTSIEYQFMTKWFERLDDAIECFKIGLVQEEYNKHLEKLYKDDLAREKKDRKYVSLTAFLLQYKECIYTRKQMIDLLKRFDEVVDAEKRASRFKEKHNIEYFTLKDLRIIVKVLKQKTKEYFNS